MDRADVTLLHLDESVAVADKPAGLLTVPGRGPDKADCLWLRVRRQVPDALVVHRLDMATSGLVLFARGPVAQRRLGAAFEQRTVGKDYVAIVQGWPDADSGRIDLPLAADWPNRPRQRVDAEQGKPSTTHWRVLQRLPATPRPTTRLGLTPVTGRSHQLRVHLAAIGHPVVGDLLYAPSEGQSAAARLLLHAAGLAFDHPADGRRLRFDSPAPF